MRKTTKYILFLALIALLLGVVSAQPLPATLDIHNDVIVSEDSGTADFIVELSNPSIFLVTVDYASADGTAMAGIDYTATSDTLTFAPGTITLGPEVYNIWVNEIGGDMAVIAIQQGVTVLGQFAPSATTGAATGVSNAGATLNGIVNAKGSSTTVTFEYGTDAGYGTTVTADQSPVTGSTDTAVSKTIGGLAPDTTYHYRVVGVNADGTTNGVDITFTTLPDAPSATTGVATAVSSSSATLNGVVNAKGSSTTVTFEYGTDAGYGTTVTADQSPVTGNANNAVSKAVSGLAPNTTYHYRVVGVNVVGTTNGVDITFTTSSDAPSATTGAATGVSNAGATLNGVVNAKGSSTTVTFEYGTDTSYGTTVTADQSPVTGSTDTAVSKTIGGLAPDTTYHYRVVVVNAVGTTNGVDITFTTLPHTPPQRGGGGGYTSIASVDRWSQGIGAGENVTLSFDETAITRIVVTAETDIPDLMISTHQATRPGSVPAPNGTVVGYVELTLYKVTDAAIRGVVIEFAVPISWLAENGFEPEQVVLLRWQDGEWQELPTNYVREDTGTAYFLAESPGLSLFAISAMEKSIPAQDTIAAEGTVAPGIGTTTVPETDLPLTEPMVAEPTAPGEPATPQTPLQYAPLLAPLVIPLLRRGKR